MQCTCSQNNLFHCLFVFFTFLLSHHRTHWYVNYPYTHTHTHTCVFAVYMSYPELLILPFSYIWKRISLHFIYTTYLLRFHHRRNKCKKVESMLDKLLSPQASSFVCGDVVLDHHVNSAAVPFKIILIVHLNDLKLKFRKMLGHLAYCK